MNQNHVIPFPAPIGFCRAQEAAKLLGISKSTFWLWVQQKTLKGINVPRPIKLSAGITVWNRSDIHAFIEQLVAQDNDETPPPKQAA
jgi:predicted DNA-binding transcriptional regulator AlpA